MSIETKTVTIFDVLNAIADKDMKIFLETGGGRQIGKGKNKNAIIEVIVDNETFQDFAFQKTYGHSKEGKPRQLFIAVAVSKDAYDICYDTLRKKRSKTRKKPS